MCATSVIKWTDDDDYDDDDDDDNNSQDDIYGAVIMA